MNEDELDVEPSECEPCVEQAEEDGVEYDFNWYVEDGQPYCEHCGRPI